MRAPLALLVSLLIVGGSRVAADPKTVPLWPDRPPGETTALPPETDTTKPADRMVAGRPVMRLGNVSTPTLSIYLPHPAKNTGAAVLVCPGGGYNIVALDLEGTEVCAWLNSIGVTGAVLKYRVPAHRDTPRVGAPLQDAQRALGLLRHQARELGIDPHRIGVMGFSAGGHLSAMLGNHHAARTYPVIDEADQVSCRPDFVALIYPGYLALSDRNYLLNPGLQAAAGTTPPTFIAMTEDDPVHVENATVYYGALKQAGIPVEMHLYPTGGHGYGLRRTADLATTWPDRMQDWMTASGWLKR